MLYHSNVPGFIIFFEASFSTTKNHSIVWDQNHFIVELFFFCEMLNQCNEFNGYFCPDQFKNSSPLFKPFIP